MRAFGTDWWPEGVKRPGLRLAAGVVLAPLIMAAVATGGAFLVAGSTFPDRETVIAATINAAATMLAGLPVMGLTTGLLAVLALWAARLRGWFAFLLAGLVAGAVFAAVTAALGGGAFNARVAGVLAVIGALQLVLVRTIAGVRRRGQ